MGEAVTTEGSSTAERVAALRAELAARGVGGFIVPRSDEYQGEYVPPCAERLAWITGFTGSAGTAVILKDRAAIFVDGRYTLQARDQVDGSVFEVVHSADKSAATWIAEALPAESRLGYDPWLHTKREAEHFRAACGKASGALVAMDTNPIDAVWSDRPAPPAAPVVPHPEAYAGRSAADKRMEIAERLAKDGADAVVLTMPDSIAWLLNIRGGDVGHTPLPLSFAILDRDGRVALFMDERKVTSGLAEHLGNAVSIVPPAEFDAALRTLGTDGKTVQIDPSGSADHVFQVLGSSGAKTREAADPCALPKAVKNAVEIEGTRHAHRRDGAALTRFLHWLSATAPQGGVTEIAAADRLEAFRREDGLFRDLSFPTISGAGSNGAIVHYRVTDSSNRPLQPGELYLVDSGAQYPDGTTDVTRTVAIGAPSAEMRDRFTRVLKGHIAIATARFPRGTNGGQLDTLARLALWQAGLDYDHGTGHGVGSYLGVHEGPQRISKAAGTVALAPGMIVSNEPGYYKTGAYGIRIENLVTVVEMPEPPGGDRPLLGFETLTLAPIDRALVDRDLLDADELAWLDGYHARVRETLTPLVDSETAAWLDEVTRPI
ncbi:MAG: X-Pro aminopeptidase [Rhodospirillaceae bacterium]|nr:X-Pro aminopeptidase [Rhodospirillaceae bacterium]